MNAVTRGKVLTADEVGEQVIGMHTDGKPQADALTVKTPSGQAPAGAEDGTD
ncbi:MAG: hypothetical protein ABSG53_12380 [Thermoguttaceae bacterium]|jgi:hypothetical protein